MQTRTDLLEKESWTVEDATALYLIDRWGSGYFHVDDAGAIRVAPFQESGASVKIIDVVREALEQGLKAPMLIRFQDLLRHRVVILNEAFNRAIYSFERFFFSTRMVRTG